MDLAARIGNRIKELRSASGLSQAEVAERLGKDVAVGTISRWERGTRVPPLPQLDRLVTVLGYDLAGFFNGVEATPVDPLAPELRRVVEAVRGLPAEHLGNVVQIVRLYRAGVATGPATPDGQAPTAE